MISALWIRDAQLIFVYPSIPKSQIGGTLVLGVTDEQSLILYPKQANCQIKISPC